MDIWDAVKSFATTRLRAVVVAIVFVLTYVPYALSAYRTHIGVPPFSTFVATMAWPSLAALLLCGLHRWLPAGLIWSWRPLWTPRRRRVLRILVAAACVTVAAAMLTWRHVFAFQALGLAVFMAFIVLGPVLRSEGDGAEDQPDDTARGSGIPKASVVAEGAQWATTVLVLSLALPIALVSYGLMARLPAGAGGLREKCVQLVIDTTGMPLPARQALIGDAAKVGQSAGSELSLPLRVLRRDEQESFLWIAPGRGISIVNELIRVKLDYDEAAHGCTQG